MSLPESRKPTTILLLVFWFVRIGIGTTLVSFWATEDALSGVASFGFGEPYLASTSSFLEDFLD